MSRWRHDGGSALVEFVLVGTMLTTLFLALLQLGIDFHVRNVLQACAADGARYGANADVRSAAVGARRADRLAGELLGTLARTVRATPSTQRVDGQPVVVVQLSARLPAVLGFLPVLPVRVRGRAVLEP